jgi:hypothetical protein
MKLTKVAQIGETQIVVNQKGDRFVVTPNDSYETMKSKGKELVPANEQDVVMNLRVSNRCKNNN